jgi:hypothetical protein
MYSLALIIFVVSEKKAFEHFPIGSGLSSTLDPMGIFFQNASSLKPLGQLKPNCPGMIIGRSSTKIVFLCRSEIQDGRHRPKNLKYVEDHPMNIHVQFGFNHICSF